VPENIGEDLVRRGHEALAAGDSTTARACFEEAGESAEALDGLGQALQMQGEFDAAIEVKARAFAAYRAAGQLADAAVVARWTAFLHACVHGDIPAAGAWMARAESVLDGVDECAEHGWLLLNRAPFTGDHAEREQLALAAAAIARRYGDSDLEFNALSLLGESYVGAGRVAEGMSLLDQAMAALSAGEIAERGCASEIYCRMLSACELVEDVSRAEAWIATIDRFALWTDFVKPTCRTHYGGILVALGRWDEAEHELLAAAEAFARGYRGERVFTLVRLADLRVRQGRYEEAEQLMAGVEWHPRARRAAAAIAFARGDLGLARDVAGLCLDGAAPSDPACAPVLELLVRIHLARGNLQEAQQAADQLSALAGAEGERAQAFADCAAGEVLAAVGDAGATAMLKQALERFARLEMPFEAGRAQLRLARTLVAKAPDAAASEARLAFGAFERLGAARDADEAAGLLRELGATGRPRAAGRGGLTAREAEVLSLIAAGLSNADIARRLFISRRTAEHHAASILAKLDLHSRAEAAAYAVREGIAEQVRK
jgi:DNA-binding CsgD family transcriptional regulator